jgi:SET domain
MAFVFDPKLLNGECLKVAPSTIPNSGRGVYVTRGVKQNEVVGQYFGDVYPVGKKVTNTPETDDKLYITKENKTIVPAPECLAQFINDCLSVEAVEALSLEGLHEICEEYNKAAFTRDDARTVVKEVLKMTDDDTVEFLHLHRVADECEDYGELLLEHNVDWEEKCGRVFIVAKRDIDEGEELFIDYGTEYWVTGIVRQMRKKYFDLWVDQAPLGVTK